MRTTERIIEYIKQNGKVRAHDLIIQLNISPRAVFKHLRNLLARGVLSKIGKPPKVFYYFVSQDLKHTVESSDLKIDPKIIDQINERYLYVSPAGEMKAGWDGFVVWCNKTKQDPIKTAKEYVDTLKKYDEYSKNGLIDGMPKIQATFPKVYLDKLFYLDFYSIERFGKTKLGQLLLHAKNSQDRKLIRELCDLIRPRILQIIEENSINGILYIPPTIKREIQLMKELERNLGLPIRSVNVTKAKTPVTIAQKTLSKLDDRIENAQKTIVVEETNQFKNILLIDDAVGSGATLNETAKQIVNKNICSGKIIGLAITGSFKGFDVISEV